MTILALALLAVLEGGDREVRDARARFNAAIVERDAAAIGRLLAPGYHIVTGRSDHSHGASAEQAKWKDRDRRTRRA